MKASRRSFLTVCAFTPALALAGKSRALKETTPVESSFDPWIEVYADNLRHNVQQIYRRVGSRPILAVIKNNAYGLGLIHAARLLEPLAAINGFAVVKLQEAIALRQAGIRKPVLLMGPFDEKELEEVVRREIMPMVYTPVGPSLDRVSRKLQKTISLHVCVDTGIGRVGVPFRQAASLLRDLAARESARIEGTMMTFTEDPDLDKEQWARFQAVCGALEKEGVRTGKKHAVSSYGLFQHPEAFADMVRPGMAIYGIYPEPPFRSAGTLILRPAVSLKARVIYVKRLQKGDTAGYNRAYVAQEEVWVATLPVGHADGWPRAAVKGAHIRIGGALYPVIGSVSASHSIVEIGSEPRVRIGDVATFFDGEDGSRPEDVAAACGSSVYDLSMHLSPSLPRRVL